MSVVDICDIVWVEKGGIVGRGVLLDYVSYAKSKNIPINCFSTTTIPVSILKEIASIQGTTFQPSDILFVRTGWMGDADWRVV